MALSEPDFIAAVADEAAVYEVLPPLARELVRVLGFKPALQFMQVFGGTRLSMAKGYEQVERLVARGIERGTAEKLVEFVGGGHFEPPGLASVERLLRDTAVRHAYDEGVAPAELARRFHITQRTVRAVLSRAVATAPRSLHSPHAAVRG